MTARVVRRVLFGLAVCNLALVLVALLLPPRGMVIFPPLALCRGAYVGLVAGAIGAFGAGFALLIPKAVP